MSPYAQAILVSLAANAVVTLPIMFLHSFPLLDSLGIAVIIAIGGAAPAMRACTYSDASADEKRRLATKFALFTPIFILVLHAILWSEARFTDTGHLLPGTVLHWTNWLLAIVGLTAWIATYYSPRNTP